MKVVINVNFGGFSLPQEVADKLGCGIYGGRIDENGDYTEIERTDPNLIKALEEYPSPIFPLCIVEIPENATDWRIDEYDGAENIIAVINGKIVDFA